GRCPEGHRRVLVEDEAAGRAFECCLPETFIRMELGEVEPSVELPERWVSVDGRDWVNWIEHQRLASLGLIPLDHALAEAAAPSPRAASPGSAALGRAPSTERRHKVPAKK